MTVAELRTVLLEFPQDFDDFDVKVEGCDCLGIATGVGVDPGIKTVCITRNADAKWGPWSTRNDP